MHILYWQNLNFFQKTSSPKLQVELVFTQCLWTHRLKSGEGLVTFVVLNTEPALND